MDSKQVWDASITQLRSEMGQASFNTWFKKVKYLEFNNDTFVAVAPDSKTRDWVADRVTTTLQRILSGMMNDSVSLSFITQPSIPDNETEKKTENKSGGNKYTKPTRFISSPRNIALHKAYGSKRAGVIQPENIVVTTNYFFKNYVKKMGSNNAMIVIWCRKKCIWRPEEDIFRNVVYTTRDAISADLGISEKTIDRAWDDPYVKMFLRHEVTWRKDKETGQARKAGIKITVRMDDPLTEEDALAIGIQENYDFSEDGVAVFDEFDILQ